jgi:SAM-dependent methyltransferase
MTTPPMPVSQPAILLDTAHHQPPPHDGTGNTPQYHRALRALLDEFTRRRIRGLVTLKGARCLDVVTGQGRLARWLADEVGEQGHVLATDFGYRDLPQRPNLTVLAHDITTGVPPGTYDFINLRLVLAHLCSREHVLHRLVDRLNPGGVLLTQDWFMGEVRDFVIQAPTDLDTAVLRRTYHTYLQILRQQRYEPTWAAQAHDRMIHEGLLDVNLQVLGAPRDHQWRGGGPGAQYMSACFNQLREPLIANRMSAVALDRVRNLLRDPLVVIRAHQLCSVSGHKPGSNPHTKRPGKRPA